MKFSKKILKLFLVPIIFVLMYHAYNNKNYMFVSFLLVLISVMVLLIKVGNRSDMRLAVILSVLIAFSATGRFMFAMIPGFKPVGAIVIIAGIYLGSESGFLVGAASMLISNFYFGQGPWTPFQMFSFGIIGYISGMPIISSKLKNSKIVVLFFSFFAGFLYSLLMDVWTTLSATKNFNIDIYMLKVATSFPFTLMYAFSNVVFILFLQKPIGEQIERIKIKYGIM